MFIFKRKNLWYNNYLCLGFRQITTVDSPHLSPAVQWHVDKNHLNVSNIIPSGPKGNITKRDILYHLARQRPENISAIKVSTSAPMILWIDTSSVTFTFNFENSWEKIIEKAIERAIKDLGISKSDNWRWKLQSSIPNNSASSSVIEGNFTILEIAGLSLSPTIGPELSTRISSLLHNPYLLLL